MLNSRIYIFPNTAVHIDGKDTWTTKSIWKFMVDLRNNGLVPVLSAATLYRTPGTRQVCKLGENEFYALGMAFRKYHFLFISKALSYLISFIRLIFCVPKKACWYVFLPGTMGILVCLTCCLFKVRYGLYVRNEWHKTGLIGILYRHYFRKAEFIITTGSSFAKTLHNFNDRVEEVSPMMQISINDIREKNSYVIDAKARILFVGVLHPEKGAFELIKAMPAIKSQYDVELLLAGSGNPKVEENLRNLIQKCGCTHNVTLLGHIGSKQKLAELYEAADLFALPTYYVEGFPRVVYEAMGFGLPVICTELEGGMHFLHNRVNCRIVAKRDVEDLIACLLELLASESTRQRIGVQAFQDAKNLFSRFEGVTHGDQVARAFELIK